LPAEAIELLVDLLNHHGLLSEILRDFCDHDVVRPTLIQRRTISRVLDESRNMLMTLLQMLQARILNPTQEHFASTLNACNRDMA
jgi:hypothetical protein